MAAYAAVVSVLQILHQIENHPSPPISIHKQQLHSLTENLTFLQEFLDCYDSPFAYSDEADPLEIRIADAAYATEYVIETRIMNRIHTRSSILGKLTVLSHELFRGLSKCSTFKDDINRVIEEMNLIRKEVTEMIADKPAVQARVQLQLQREVSSTDHGGSSSTVKKESMMVGVDQVVLEVLDKLTRGQLNRQIIPITGMGGIGKTTLARTLFEKALTKEYFDIRVWTTISQVYDTTETLRDIYSQVSGHSRVLSEDELGEELREIYCQASGHSRIISEDELGEQLYKYLSGRRYLIVMDDIWCLEAWEKMKFSFPDNNNGSRIIVTTRLSNMASRLSESYGVGMKFLDEASSWDLFCKTVFGEEDVPLELEKIGKKIVAKCRGLPLAIATIGGLLVKSQRTREYWKHIEENLNSIVITENDEFCLKILKLSYVNLPNYLKPCFLYMGVFKEDLEIHVSTLTKLWVSEGFLKPICGKYLEIVAEEYFNDLVGRNLILVHQLGSNGNVKLCKIHDLLRDLCLREAANERFYHVLRHPPQGINSKCKIVIPTNTSYKKVCQNFDNLRLLRTLKSYDGDNIDWGCDYSLGDVFRLVNSRFLAVEAYGDTKLPCLINRFWNLQTLIIHRSVCRVTAPTGIWKMSQLRHVEFSQGMYLPDPPSCHNDITIMGNLQTLRGVRNFSLDENVVRRIPNIRILDVSYVGKLIMSVNCLSYLQYLSKLETFRCYTEEGCDEYLQRISFPHSLKKFKLNVWNPTVLELEEDILQKVSSLPLLQKLALNGGFFRRRKWETIEGQFPSLKLLDLSNCRDFMKWTMAESSHFPLLQELRLHGLYELEEIPSEIGEIATLKSIVLASCSRSVVLSAKKIVEEQEDLHGDLLDLHVTLKCITAMEAYALQYLTSPNFHVSVWS